jgi:diaminohydroxyphosphoribosylaminopyrimidine deaminase/5-amino-6-(5-phosphoribosylamino)uracil reductase
MNKYYFCGVKIHEKYIARCIELAKSGLGTTYPNPMVGAVVVCDGKVIGEGWHRKAGEAHAEVHAIGAVAKPELLQRSTLYVSLEPCAHRGRTPPCTDLILEKGIPRVVIGARDDNPEVTGGGLERLEQQGCEVISGILEEECLELNRRFFTFHRKNRPYIILKWAQTSDGFIDRVRNTADPIRPNWITGPGSRQLVHKMRSEEQAILVGTKTVLNDNPGLDVRECTGDHPLRLYIDRNLVVPDEFKIKDGKQKTICYTEKEKTSKKEGLIYVRLDFNKAIADQILEHLYTLNIQSLIVEGGSDTLQRFIDLDLWDEARVFTGELCFGEGLRAPDLGLTPVSEFTIAGDRIQIFRNV